MRPQSPPSPMRAIRHQLLAATLAALVMSPLAAAQGVRRGLEQRSSGAPGSGFGTYHAIIFAVGDQQERSGLPSLRFPIKEADSLRAVITREYTFDPKNVQVVKNPTREAILDTLEVLTRRLGPDDNLLVVYSGHGGFDERSREGYWLAADAANARPSTWIPNESIRTWLRTLKARSVLLITDACFSGSLNRSNDERVDLPADNQLAIAGAMLYARRTSRQAMTAGTAKETVPQVSIFSMEIVAALKRRRAPVFMAQQLAGEINPRVAAVAHTTPTFSAVPGIESDQGDFVFVRRNAPTDVAAASAAVTPAPAQTGVQRGGAAPATGGTRESPPVGSTASTTVQRGNAAPVTSGTRDISQIGTLTPAPASTPSASTMSKMGNIVTSDAPATPQFARASSASATRATTSIAVPGCAGGVASGCVSVGLNNEYGRNGVARSVPRAVGLYRLACDAKDGDACMNLGRMYDSPHEGVSMDRGKARQLFAQACEAGSGAACTYSGMAIANGEGAPADAARAAQLFSKACDAGHEPGCGLLGVAYANGKGVPQDDARASALIQRSCAASDATGCGTLGTMIANGRGGGARDSTKAVGFWKRGCQATPSNSEACVNLGTSYLRGSGSMRDDVRAIQYFSQACEDNHARGCTMLGGMYEEGSAVTAKSATRAAEFYKRGCTGNDQQACAWISAHPQTPVKP